MYQDSCGEQGMGWGAIMLLYLPYLLTLLTLPYLTYLPYGLTPSRPGVIPL